jgi:hypothetical protein
VFIVDYSWGPPPAGGFKTKGREAGDQFVIKWKNKRGVDVERTLKKVEDNKVAARQEKSGVLGPKERPYMETYLNHR